MCFGRDNDKLRVYTIYGCNTMKAKSKAVFLSFLFSLAFVTTSSRADVLISVNTARQTIEVLVDGAKEYNWTISSGTVGHRTPKGTFRPGRMYEEYFSFTYDGMPMPHSIFFYRGYAIHGTLDIRDLGRPASKGCVRLHPDHAKLLFELVREHGMTHTRVTIH